MPVIDVVGAVLDGRDRKFCALRICGHGCAGVGGRSGRPSRSYYPPLPPAIYDWTGIHVGGHSGGGMLVDSVSQNGVSPGGFNLLSSGNLRPTGVIVGAQNWR